MAKNKKQTGQKQCSPQEYIRSRARMLPLGDCYVSSDWKECGEALACVVRLHPQYTYTVGVYLIDTFCLGVKDSYWYFSIDELSFRELLERFNTHGFSKVPYEEVHNLIYGAVAFAEEGGISPHESFRLTQYLLEEDTDDIPLIEYDFGKDGKHFLCANSRMELSECLPKLQKALGDDFMYTLPGMEEPKEGKDYVDLKVLDQMYDALGKVANYKKIPEEEYAFAGHPEYPTELRVKHPWLADRLYSPEKNFDLTDDDLEEILALPHDELRADLEQIMLYEVGQTCKEISDERWNEDPNSVMFHCLSLLGHLGYAESLPAVLITLCQNEAFYEFHFGDFLSEIYVPVLYKLGANQTDTLMQYMQTPGLYTFARISVPEMMTWLAVQHPERRTEVIEWFRTLLVFYDGKLETRQCCDGLLVGMMTGLVLDLHAEELLPELKKLYDTGLVDEECSGNFKTVVKEMKDGLKSFVDVYCMDIRESYKKFKKLVE